MYQCLDHYLPLDSEYRRIRLHLSEYITVSDGTSAFTHVDVGDHNEDNRRGRAYPPEVDTINAFTVFEDLSLLRNKEPPSHSPPNPLLPWERRDGGETTTTEEDSLNTLQRMIEPEAETQTPVQGDVLDASIESVVESPVAKMRRIESDTIAPTRTYGLQGQITVYGPYPPPDENSDGDPAAHLRTRDDELRMLEDRLRTREFEIDRRDAIRARNEADVTHREDFIARNRATPEAVAARPSIAKALGRHEDDLMVNVLSRVTTDPNLEHWYVPMSGPTRPPPPRQSDVNRDMEQARSAVKAKNASGSTGTTSAMSRSEEIELHADGPRPVVKPPPSVPPRKPPPPFFDSPYRSEDDEPTGLRVMSPGEPIPHGKMVMSPALQEQEEPQDDPPADWAITTALAAKKAAAVIAQAKEKAFPSALVPKAKPGPKGFDWVPNTGKASSCPVLKAILDRNADEPLPPPPEAKPPPVRYTPAERNAIAAAKERQWRRDKN
eukprot:6471832-Amphidinium_carterae.1